MPSKALVAAGACVVLMACGPDDIERRAERAQSAWSELQNQNRRRADLVPKLVETVKTVAAQEREVLAWVAEARARAADLAVDASTIADPALLRAYQEAQERLSMALGQLLSTVERYPELKSNSGYQAQRALLQTAEDRIAVARSDYTAAARAHNAELETAFNRGFLGIFQTDARPMALPASPLGAQPPR